MSQLNKTWCLALALALALAPAMAQAQWGDLKGQFLYDGKAPEKVEIKAPGVELKEKLYDLSLMVDEKTGGIANIVIYCRTKDVMEHPDYAKSAKDEILFDNKGFRFQPRVTTIRLSQTLVFGNSDPVSHNSNFQPIGDVGVNPLLPAGGTVKYNAAKAQNIPQPVGCNIHGWMRGYILPRKDPYATVTAADGTFVIKNLPAGDLEFVAWHEKAGYLVAKKEWEKGRFTVKIESGKPTDLGALKVDPALLNKQ